jgi:hypothetical protein
MALTARFPRGAVKSNHCMVYVRCSGVTFAKDPNDFQARSESHSGPCCRLTLSVAGIRSRAEFVMPYFKATSPTGPQSVLTDIPSTITTETAGNLVDVCRHLDLRVLANEV